MKDVKVYLKSRRYNATGIFDNGKITIQKGSIINSTFGENYAFSPKVKAWRESKDYVDKQFVLKKDITFSSPSTAAQFVLGYSANGWKSWRTENKEYIEIFRES